MSPKKVALLGLMLSASIPSLGCSSTVAGRSKSEEPDISQGGQGGASNQSGSTGGSSGTNGSGGANGTGGDSGSGGSNAGTGGASSADLCEAVVQDLGVSCSDQGDESITANQTWSAGCRSYNNLTIQGGTVTFETSPFDGPSVLVVDELTLALGADLDATQQGYASGIGPGKGVKSDAWGTGAGHGGKGGSKGLAGGATYGDENYPITAGSGGGNNGGKGGGALLICARTAIHVDGKILSSGGNGGASGGGAGGSILLLSPTITGSGEIVANGGSAISSNCAGSGGGGGGGRVALLSDSDSFEGTLAVEGGASGCGGASDGDDGSIRRTVLP